jgi:hypothetical protein
MRSVKLLPSDVLRLIIVFRRPEAIIIVKRLINTLYQRVVTPVLADDVVQH